MNDGTIAFTQSVDGHVTGAYFEGDGEILMRPPDRMERASLGLFINAGVLEEKFSSAYFRFNDDTAKELQAAFCGLPRMPPISSRSNDATARMLAQIDAMRLCISFTSAPAVAAPGEPPPVPDRLLHARIAGNHYGIFDVFFDTRSPEQVVVGNASTHEDQSFYDLWMSFPMRSLRKTPLSDARFGGPSGPLWTPNVLAIDKYTVNADARFARATLSADGHTRCGCEAGRYAHRAVRTFALSAGEAGGVSRASRWSSSRTKPLRAASCRAAATTPSRSSFLRRLQPGARFQLRFTYAGSVMSDAEVDCCTSARAEPGIPTAAWPWRITISHSTFRRLGL